MLEEGDDKVRGVAQRLVSQREETFLARAGQEIGASLIVGIMNKVHYARRPSSQLFQSRIHAHLFASLFHRVPRRRRYRSNPSTLPFIAR